MLWTNTLVNDVGYFSVIDEWHEAEEESASVVLFIVTSYYFEAVSFNDTFYVVVL